MQRLNSVQPENAEARAKALLDTVQQAFGTVPNAAKVMANSPAVLQSFLGFSTAMGEARIGEKLHNQIKLNTSENNECEYCTSILSAVAPTAGLSAAEVLVGRTGQAEDTRIKAALTFANDVLETRGKVTDDRLASVKSAGFDDGQIVEVVASVVLGCFTNFLNNVADTQLDVPPAEAIEPSAACSSGACSVH